MLTFLSLSLCFVLVSVSVQQQTTSTNIVSVTLPSGHTVRGVRKDVYGFPSTVQIFKGLPYAKPPLGELRLKPPQEPEPRMVNATSWRASCQQSKGSDFNEWSEEIKSAGLSEDCLFLNVWVPDLATTGEVMVWIHGGGYVMGSDTLFERRKQHRLTLLFKLVHEPALRHFQYLLPQLLNNPEVRRGRHIMHFNITVNPRIKVCEKSFVHLTCTQWNELDPTVRQCTSIAAFKRLTRGAILAPVPSLCELPRWPSILYNRLKYSCSALNVDLFHANLIESNLCDCRLAPETLFHFMYDCPFHDVPREYLMFELSELGLLDMSLNVLFRPEQFSDPNSVQPIQRAVFRYIIGTGRFA